MQKHSHTTRSAQGCSKLEHDAQMATYNASKQLKKVLLEVVLPHCRAAGVNYYKSFQPREIDGSLYCPICPETGPFSAKERRTRCRHERTKSHLAAVEKELRLKESTLMCEIGEKGLCDYCSICDNWFLRNDSWVRHKNSPGQCPRSPEAVAARKRARAQALANESDVTPPPERQRPAPYHRPRAHEQRATASAPLPEAGPSSIGPRRSGRTASKRPARADRGAAQWLHAAAPQYSPPCVDPRWLSVQPSSGTPAASPFIAPDLLSYTTPAATPYPAPGVASTLGTPAFTMPPHSAFYTEAPTATFVPTISGSPADAALSIVGLNAAPEGDIWELSDRIHSEFMSTYRDTASPTESESTWDSSFASVDSPFLPLLTASSPASFGSDISAYAF